MPTFATAEPITASIELAVGDARIAASDRADTVVEVRPTNPDNEADVRAAAETRVEFSPGSGQLVVRGPKPRGLGRMARTASIDISVELPTGSQVEGSAAAASFRLLGRVGVVPAQDLGRRHPDRGERPARRVDQRGRGHGRPGQRRR